MPRLRDVDDLLIAHLAAGKTVCEAARLAGCSVATAHRRLNDPAFRLAVRRARQEIIEAIRGDLRKAASLAVATLESLLASDEPGIRLRAADALLSHFRALHGDVGEGEEVPAPRTLKIIYEVVDSSADLSAQARSPYPPEDKPVRVYPPDN